MNNPAWKPIPKYVGVYEVSHNGEVRRVDRKAFRTLKPYKNTHGYLIVSLSLNGQVKDYSVHSLVLKAFVGDCPDGLEINHINGVRDDNNLNNLEYVTRSDNHLHRTQVLRHGIGETNPMTSLKDIEVDRIRGLYRDGLTQKQIAKMYSTTREVISRIVLGKTWKHLPSAKMEKRKRLSTKADLNPNAKLTWEQVRRIRSLYPSSGLSQDAIAKMFAVSQLTVSLIVRNKIWIE